MAQLIFVPFPGGGGTSVVQIFRSNIVDNGTDLYTFNTGFGHPNNEVVSVTVRNELDDQMIPSNVFFDTLNNVTINLAAARAENGGTLPAGYRVVIIG